MRLFVWRVPYDWKNPIGYLATTIYQYISLQQFLGFLGLSATFGIGSLLLGIAIVRTMKTLLKSANNSAISEKHNNLQALKMLNEFIELHAKMKE